MPRQSFTIEYPEDGHRCADLVVDLSLTDDTFAARIAGAELTAVERFVDLDELGVIVGDGYVVALHFPDLAPHPGWTSRMTVLSSGKFAATEDCGSLDDCFEGAGTVIDLVLADDESFRSRYADFALASLGTIEGDGNHIVEVGPLDRAVDARWREHLAVDRPSR